MTPTDADGNRRVTDDPDADDIGIAVIGYTVDMGAYEVQPEAPCAADLNGDGQINGADLGLLLGAWGFCD